MIATVETLRRQHDEVRALISRLEELLQIAPVDAALTRDVLFVLSGLLRSHFDLEDVAFYPLLRDHADPRVASMATRFTDEMGGLASAFASYAERWGVPDAIERAPRAFIEESNVVLAALIERVVREDNELYFLLAGLGD